MTFKSILFCLFLYVCLVWVGAYYFYSGDRVQQIGLLWTGVGLLAVLVLMLASRLFGGWRMWRARNAGKPAVKLQAAQERAQPVHEEEAALTALINEANAVLSRTKAYANKAESRTLSDFPIYLLIGPEGSGKTDAFLNANLEPQLLAGQATRAGATGATRVCNIWLAQERVFIELAGRAFGGELDRWKALLLILQMRHPATRWQRLWKEPKEGPDLRGVIAFCDAASFTAAASPQGRERLETQIHQWQERLGAIAEVFGIECPVHLLVTKSDAIPYFSDYFRRVPESETGQFLGCAMPVDSGSRRQDASAETESKWLTKSFNALYYSLAEGRTARLSQEPDVTRRPAIYEFPREFKRIRGPFVQFLTMLFRPNPLRPGPKLRGFYLSGTIEREMALSLADSRTDWKQPSSNLEATSLFRAEATQIMRGGGGSVTHANFTPAGPLVRRWLFVSELFASVVPADPRPQRAPKFDSRREVYRQVACIAVCGVCLVLCFALFNSWIRNSRLLHSLRNETVAQKKGSIPTLAELQSLDDLRAQLSELSRYGKDGPPLGLRWGLYSGNGILQPIRQTYFRRFQSLLLNRLNGTIVNRLERLPSTPGPSDAYSPVFRLLRTHIMISSGGCKPDPSFVAGVLKQTREEAMGSQDANWQSLADRQIDFYASQLESSNLPKLAENAAARDRARTYLANSQGADRVYVGLLAAARKSFPNPQRLSNLAPGYQQVLSGSGEVEGVFSRDGWNYFEKAAKTGKNNGQGEACVLGEHSTSGGEGKRDRETQRALQRMFLRDYAEHWRKYLMGFSVNRFYGPGDAARKLEILSGHKSPLLALMALSSNQTTLPDSIVEPEVLDKVKPIVRKYFPKLAGDTQAAHKTSAIDAAPREGISSPADVTKAFQPVHWVVPAGSETWVVDKNSAYIDALAALGHSMEDIARAGANPDAAVFQAASQNYEKALEAARQIARGFEPMGVAGLDVAVERLLEAPIRQTQGFIITDLDSAAAGKVNAQLKQVCERIAPTLRKYPFQRSDMEATLDEVAGVFAPASGAIWKFQAQSMADLLVKENGRWVVKDPAKKPQVTAEMVNFLNRAQAIADAFYPGGGSQAQFTYILRPKLDPNFKDAVLELDIDGQTHVWNSSLQKQFAWPPAPGAKDVGVRGLIRMGNVAFPFTSRPGIWAIFKVMGDAEPRALSSRLVEWKFVRGGDGRLEAIQPAPVRLEFVEFPSGVDIFNPKFLQGLECPTRAVQ